MNHTTKSIAPLDLTAAPFRHRWRWLRRRQTQRSMWTMAVVVINEDAKDVVEMGMVEDQEPVETLRADGAHFWSVANFFASRWSCAPLKGLALPVWLYSPQGWQLSFLWVSRAPTPKRPLI